MRGDRVRTGAPGGGGADERKPLDHRGAAQRGAWYADPFEQADERWWDGRSWTNRVRSAPDTGSARAQARQVRIAGSTHSAADRALVDEVEESQPAFLPIETAVGQMARLVPAHSLTSGSWRRVTARAPHSYELLAIAGPIGTVALGGGNDLARVQCENGEWRLRKRRRLGLELLIEAADGRQAGLYSGRQWLGGGTISLTDESEFELRRVPPRGWRLRGMDPELLVDFRAPAGPGHRVTVTIRALAQDSVGAQLALLTACAVLTLEWTLSGASLGGG